MTTTALNPTRFDLIPDLERELGREFMRSNVIPRFTAAGECMVCNRVLGDHDALTVVSPSSADTLAIAFALALSPAHRSCVPGHSGFLGSSGIEVVASATFRCVPAVFTDPVTQQMVLIVLLNPAVDQVVLFQNRDVKAAGRWTVHDPTGAGNREPGWFRAQRDQSLLALARDDRRPSVGEIDLAGSARLWNGYGFHVNTVELARTAADVRAKVVGALVFVSDLLAVPESTDRELFKEFMTIAAAGRLEVR